MSARDVRDDCVAAFESIIARADLAGQRSYHAMALELVAAAEGRGVRFTAPAHHEDPAADWRAPVEPGDTAAGLAAARSALGLPADTDEAANTNGAAQ